MGRFEVHNVGSVIGGEAFLIVTEGKTAMIDTGFSFTAKETVGRIKDILGNRPLDYILLTHSHYDHVSGASKCKRTWKDAKIVSSKHAAEVFEKPSVIRKICDLNRSAAKTYGRSQFFLNDMKMLHTDIVVREGDVIDFGPMELKVIEAPGHTWDSIAFWCEEEKFMATCETMGVITGEDTVMPACLVSYSRTIDFIRREQELAPKQILVPHYGMLYGDECTKFISNALYWNDRYRGMVVDGYRKGKTVDELKAETKKTFYVGVVRQGQPEKAFDLNNSYMVPMMIKECCEHADDSKK